MDKWKKVVLTIEDENNGKVYRNSHLIETREEEEYIAKKIHDTYWNLVDNDAEERDDETILNILEDDSSIRIVVEAL